MLARLEVHLRAARRLPGIADEALMQEFGGDGDVDNFALERRIGVDTEETP